MEMETVVVAFASAKTCERIRDILESSGAAACLVCRSAAEVKRTVGQQRAGAVVCGFKLPDETAEELSRDLPPTCPVLLVAVQNLLDLCQSESVFRLASPVSRGDLVASVGMLLRMAERAARPKRGGEERALVERAKALLMDRHGMTEEQAHRFLQKKSMDSGVKIAQTAKMVLGGQ